MASWQYWSVVAMWAVWGETWVKHGFAQGERPATEGWAGQCIMDDWNITC